jgi:hypothetical protein
MNLSPDDFHFRIDLWDDADKRIEQVIAFVSDLGVARAAFTAAVKATSPASTSRCGSVRAFSIRAFEKAKTPTRGAFANVCAGITKAGGKPWLISRSAESADTFLSLAENWESLAAELESARIFLATMTAIDSDQAEPPKAA